MFHRVRQRKAHRHIYMLKNRDSNWVDDQQELVKIIYHHFTQLYSPCDNRDISSPTHAEEIDMVLRKINLPQLSNSHQEALLNPFSSEEIQQTFFELPHNKSPGMDGFPAEFFQRH